MRRTVTPRRWAAAVLALAAVPGVVAAGPRPVDTWTVDEATTAILIPDHRAPVVVVQAEFPAGEWSAWAREADLATALEIQLWDPDGTLRRRADELATAIVPWSGPHAAGVRLYCSTADLDRALALLGDVLANHEFDRSELRRRARQARIVWQASLRNVQFRGRQGAARLLFHEDDPRRRPYEGPRRVETDPRRLAAIRDRLLRLPGRTIGFAGDVDRARAEAIAATLLPPAGAAGDVDPAPALEPLRPLDRRDELTLPVPELTQVFFGLVREALPVDHPDYPAFVLANHVLGGHFYSRLSVALRHESGDSYGAFVVAGEDVAPVPFSAASFTRTANAGGAEARLRETLDRFARDGIDEAERRAAAGHLLGRRPFDRRTPVQTLDRRMRERRLGLDEGFLDGLPERAAALSLDELNRFVRLYYDPDRLRMVRVAPAR